MIGNAELISTGNELLSGRTVNRHAQTLGRILSAHGIRLVRDTSIPDDMDAIRNTVAEALDRTPLVFVSGGLGPTSDDITRNAIAGLLKRGLVIDPDALDRIRTTCAERSVDFNPHRAQQAEIVAGAVALPNRVGAAPGERIGLEDGRVLFVLPGPPSEFRAILEDHVEPWLAEHVSGSKFIEDVYMVCGLGEGDILALFETQNFPPATIDTAFCAAPGRIELRLSSAGGDRELLDETGIRVRAILGDNIFANRRATMEMVVGDLLSARCENLAVAESCTGGMLGARITAVAGSSGYFVGGVLAYSNRVKIEQLGIDPDVIETEGAVSPEVAESMAGRVRERFGSEYGIGITGIAGPGGGNPEKPVGLVYIGLADSDEVQTARFQFGTGRQRIRNAATQMALDMLRRRLQKR